MRVILVCALAVCAVAVRAQESGSVPKADQSWVPLQDPAAKAPMIDPVKDAPTEPAAAPAAPVAAVPEPAKPALSAPSVLSEVPAAPAPVSAPKPAAPAVQAPPVAAPEAPPSVRLAAEWRFLRLAGDDKRPELTETVLAQVARVLRADPDSEFADEVLRLKADLHERQGDAKAAMLAYLRLFCEYPSSKIAFPAKRAMMDLADRKFDRKLKPVFGELARGDGAGEKAVRLAGLYKKLVEQTGDALYEPLALEVEEFFARFPDYPKADELTLLLGELHVRKGRYPAAILSYQKLLALYPASAYKARAQRLIGDVLANNLKDYNKAIDAYQEVANRYPDSEEAGLAYDQIARIEEQLKQYDLAIEIYEKIVKLYPGTDAALRAYNGEARLLADSLSRPAQAIETYGKLADMFKGSPLAAKALKAGAVIAHKQKDYSTELALDERIAKDVPDSVEAPEALFAAAEICEDQLLSPEKAIDLYNQVASKYASHKLAKKAKGRAESLAKKK